jgi:hypothetical protein
MPLEEYRAQREVMAFFDEQARELRESGHEVHTR